MLGRRGPGVLRLRAATQATIGKDQNMTMGADRQTATAHYAVDLLTVCAERLGTITIVRVDGEVDMQTCGHAAHGHGR